MKKSGALCSLIISTMLIEAISAFPVHTAETNKIRSFFEDFESYNIEEIYSDNGIITNGKPKDGLYTDTGIYPNGTASVYEGNAADNLFVYDYAGNKIYGGLPGWYGYYDGKNDGYNKYNRRVSVTKTANTNSNDINPTQFLKLEPHKNTNSIAMLNKNNLDFSGYSMFSTRFSISSDNTINKIGIALTKNPEGVGTDDIYDIVTFTDTTLDDGTTKGISINVNDVSQGKIAYSSYNKSDLKKDWYTLEYRLYQESGEAKHSIYIINDNTGEVIVKTAWQAVDTAYGFWNDEAVYGIRFYAQSFINVSQPRVIWDDIRFTKESFTEDFERYNTYMNFGDSKSYMLNAPKGNLLNETAYGKGAFEGLIQKNNPAHRTIGTVSSPKKEEVFGSVPFWQGYIKDPFRNDEMLTESYYVRNGIVDITEPGLNPQTVTKSDNVLRMQPRTGKGEEIQIAYAGMEQADFSDNTKTVWSTDIIIPRTDYGYIKLQLTKGRSITSANGQRITYDGNSFADTYDVLTLKNVNGANGFYFGPEEEKTGVGYVSSWNCLDRYTVKYTVDRTEKTPKQSLVVIHNGNNEILNIPESDIKDFGFDDNIIGFRYVTATADKPGSESIQKAIFDNISITKTAYSDEITGDADESLPVDSGIKINIDDTVVTKNITPQMYGINFEWGGQEIDYMKNSEPNPDLINVHRGIVPLARMAGGSANSMYWKKAIGDNRDDLQFWHYAPGPLRYGPVEWIKSTQQMMDGNIKYIWTVNIPRVDDSGNMIGETLEDIKDLVRFMTLNPSDDNAVGSDGINWAQKRVELGIEMPVDIFAWELGNELDLEDNGGYTVKEYMNMCKSVIDAIRSVNPDEPIAVHAVTKRTQTWALWHRALLEGMGEDIDYISTHIYYDPDKVSSGETVVNVTSQDIKDITGSDRIKVIVTEHASSRETADSGGNTYEFCKPHTMRGVIASAEFFNRMMKYSEVVASNYHSIYSSSWATCYPNENRRLYRTAIADLLEVYGENGVGNSVKCDVQIESNSTISDVTAAAVKTDDGLNIMLTNPYQTDMNVKININSDEYLPVYKSVIDAKSLKADNYKNGRKISYRISDEKEDISTYTIPARSVTVITLKKGVSIEIDDVNENSIGYNVISSDEKAAKVICAVYKDNALLSVKTEDIILEKGTCYKTIDCNQGNGDTVKLMVWSGFDNNMPLCEYDTYSIN